MKATFYIFSLILQICSPVAQADFFEKGDHYFETVGQNHIPNGLVTAMAGGPEGLMWLGTQTGLIRFDGYEYSSSETQVLW